MYNIEQGLLESLKLLPEENRLELIQAKDKGGITVLFRIFEHYIEELLPLLPENDRLAALAFTSPNDEFLLIDYVKKNPENLITLLKLLPDVDSIRDVLEKKDEEQRSVLHWIADSKPEYLVEILNLFPDAKSILNFVKLPDKNGRTLKWSAKTGPIEAII